MKELNLQRQEAPLRRLMGPGPLDVHPRVYKALSSPVIGYMDPVVVNSVLSWLNFLDSVFFYRYNLMGMARINRLRWCL